MSDCIVNRLPGDLGPLGDLPIRKVFHVMQMHVLTLTPTQKIPVDPQQLSEKYVILDPLHARPSKLRKAASLYT